MIRLLWTASVEVRYFLRRYMPSNIVLDLLRTRRGLKWGIPAMLLSVPYLVVAHWSRVAPPRRTRVHLERAQDDALRSNESRDAREGPRS
jgi:hypothetical protein